MALRVLFAIFLGLGIVFHTALDQKLPNDPLVAEFHGRARCLSYSSDIGQEVIHGHLCPTWENRSFHCRFRGFLAYRAYAPQYIPTTLCGESSMSNIRLLMGFGMAMMLIHWVVNIGSAVIGR